MIKYIGAVAALALATSASAIPIAGTIAAGQVARFEVTVPLPLVDYHPLTEDWFTLGIYQPYGIVHDPIGAIYADLTDAGSGQVWDRMLWWDPDGTLGAHRGIFQTRFIFFGDIDTGIPEDRGWVEEWFDGRTLILELGVAQGSLEIWGGTLIVHNNEWETEFLGVFDEPYRGVPVGAIPEPAGVMVFGLGLLAVARVFPRGK